MVLENVIRIFLNSFYYDRVLIWGLDVCMWECNLG